MSVAATVLASIRTLQATLTVLTALDATAWNYPSNCTLTNGSSVDFIVVGGGTAGCVVAGRLSENSNVTVTMLEAGGYAPIQSEYPGMFPLLPESEYDYNYKSTVNEVYQNHNQSRASVTLGKMLGGSGAMSHMGHMRGDPNDYNTWAAMLNDTRWNFTNILPIMKRFEHLIDPAVLNSPYADLHGTHGPMKITRSPTTDMEEYLDAFAELYDVVLDMTSTTSAKGFTQPLYTLDDCKRVTTATAYLGQAKNRSNLCVALSNTVNKILFNGTTAIGVQITTYNGDTYVLYANKEVIITSGAVNSAKLLLQSGVGPQEDLEALNMTVVADLPVGKNLQHHSVSLMGYQAKASTAAASAVNYHKFPLPSAIGMSSLNSSQSYPDCMSINIRLPQSSTAFVQVMTNVFSYSDNITDGFYEASVGRELLVGYVGLTKPLSKGSVTLASSDPTDDPIIDLGVFENDNDLVQLGKCLADYNRILNTTYFKNVSAELIDLDLCSSTTSDDEYFQCMAKTFITNIWDIAGTCAMGKVCTSDLKVYGLSALRVADSAAMPTLISGESHAPVVMLAEQAVDFIRNDWGI